MAKTVVIVGGLVRDPELKYIKTGTAVCEFSLGSKKVFTAEKVKRNRITGIALYSVNKQRT